MFQNLLGKCFYDPEKSRNSFSSAVASVFQQPEPDLDRTPVLVHANWTFCRFLFRDSDQNQQNLARDFSEPWFLRTPRCPQVVSGPAAKQNRFFQNQPEQSHSVPVRQDKGRTFPGSDHLDPVLCFKTGKATSWTGSDPNHSWFFCSLSFCRSSFYMVLIKNLVSTEPNVLDGPDFWFSVSREAELMLGYKPPTVWIWIRTVSGSLFWTQNRCGPTETSRGSASLWFHSGNNWPTDPAEPRCSSGPTSPDQGPRSAL